MLADLPQVLNEGIFHFLRANESVDGDVAHTLGRHHTMQDLVPVYVNKTLVSRVERKPTGHS